MPEVGILFLVGDDLYIESSPLDQAEPYADHLGHPGGHSEFWDRLQAEAKVPADEEYQHIPRGRVSIPPRQANTSSTSTPASGAARRSSNRLWTLQLPPEHCKLSGDEHYHCGGLKNERIEEDAEWDLEYEKKRRLICEILGEDPDAPQPPERPINTIPLFPLAKIWPGFLVKLKDLLTRRGEHHLASTVNKLCVYDRCRCGADHCATVYTQPRPERGFGPTHRNVAFWPPGVVDLDTGRTYEQENPDAVLSEYMIILDEVRGGDGDEIIACIEALNEPDLRDRLVAALPD